LAIVVPFVEDCAAKTTFARSHGGCPLPYEDRAPYTTSRDTIPSSIFPMKLQRVNRGLIKR